MTKHPTVVDANGDPIRPGRHLVKEYRPNSLSSDCLKTGDAVLVEDADIDEDGELYVEAPDGHHCYIAPSCLTPAPVGGTPDTSRIELGDRHPNTGMVLLRSAWGNGWWGENVKHTADFHDAQSDNHALSAAAQERHTALAVMRRAFAQAEKDGASVTDEGIWISGYLITPESKTDQDDPEERATEYLAGEVQALVDAGKPLTGLPYPVRDHRTPAETSDGPVTRATRDLGEYSKGISQDVLNFAEASDRLTQMERQRQWPAPQATPTADTDDEPVSVPGHVQKIQKAADSALRAWESRTDELRAAQREARTAREAIETAERELVRLREDSGNVEVWLQRIAEALGMHPDDLTDEAVMDGVNGLRRDRDTARNEVVRLTAQVQQHEENRARLYAEAERQDATIERLTGELEMLRARHQAVQDDRAELLLQSAPEGSVVFPPGDPMHDVARIVRDLPDVSDLTKERLDTHIRQGFLTFGRDHLIGVKKRVAKDLAYLAAEAGRVAAPTEDDTEKEN